MRNVAALTVVALSLLLVPTAKGQTGSYNGFQWKQTGNALQIYGYTGPGGIVTIPETIPVGTTSLPVTSLGYQAFFNNRSVVTVSIPSSVTNIEDAVFSGCSGLATVALPDGITSIGTNEFYLCSRLTSVKIPANTTRIGSQAFSGCYGLTNLVIPNNVTSLGQAAFYNCGSLTNLSLGAGLTRIPAYAFSFCDQLPKLVIPGSITNIDSQAFSFCDSLTGVSVSPDNVAYVALDGALYNKSQTRLVLFPAAKPGDYFIPTTVRAIGPYAFVDSTLTTIFIPDTVTNIGAAAFARSANLTSIAIPDSVISLGDANPGLGVFEFCSSLTNLALSASVASIGQRAFSSCPELTSVTIPAEVIYIGQGAFGYCSALTNVCFEGSPPADGGGLFQFDPASLTISYVMGTSGWGDSYSGVKTTPCVRCRYQPRVFCICDSNTVTGAALQIGSYSTTSDKRGVYTLPGMAPGTYTATVSANHYATLTTQITVLPEVAQVTNDFYLTNTTLVFSPAFDASILRDANARAITNAVKTALQIYKQTIAGSLCVPVLFAATNDSSVPADTQVALASLPYSTYLSDLQAEPNKSPYDVTALATLPGGPGTGLNGNTEVTLTAANLAAIGETAIAADAAAAAGGGYYGKILLNVSGLNGLQAAAAHEMNEILGIGRWGSTLELAESYSGQSAPTNGVGPLDLFRYSGLGTRSFTLDPAPRAYFSLDGGKTALVSFNQFGHGSDFGDWGDGVSPADGLGNNPPQLQDAFGSSTTNLGVNEFIALDVIGYTLTPPPSVIQAGNLTGQSFDLAWSSLPGQSYQVQFATNLVQTVWNNLSGPILATNMTARASDTSPSGAMRFYRVVGFPPAGIRPSLR